MIGRSGTRTASAAGSQADGARRPGRPPNQIRNREAVMTDDQNTGSREQRDLDEAGRLAALAATDLLTPFSVRVAATLRLADLIAGGASRVDELAARSASDRDALYQLLRHLSGQGVFRESEPGVFTLTAVSRALEDGHPSGLRRRLDLNRIEGRMDLASTRLGYTVRTGQPAWAEVFGRPFFEDLTADRHLFASFNEVMGPPGHRDEVAAVVEEYDWREHRHVVDVAGGNGAVLAEILRASPETRGTLVNTHTAETEAQELLSSAGLAERTEIVTVASIFDPLPAGADLYFLGGVVQNWGDEDALRILRRCAEAAGRSGRVLIAESLRPDEVRERGASTGYDLVLLVCVGGRTRTARQLTELVARAGLEARTTTRTRSTPWLVECFVRPPA
jgi:hypothetical protein